MKIIKIFLFCLSSYCGDFEDFLKKYKNLPDSFEITFQNFLYKGALGDGRILILLNSFSESDWLKESIKLSNNEGKSALQIAWENNNEAEVIELLKLGAGIPIENEKREDFYNFLLNVAKSSDSFLANLADLKFDFNFKFSDGDYFSHKLIKSNIIKSFFFLSEAQLIQKNEQGLSPLHLAAEELNIEFLKSCLNKNNINDTTSDISKRTILHIIASTDKNSDDHDINCLVKELIELGANPGLQDAFGATALFYANQKQNIKALNALLPYFSKKEIEIAFDNPNQQKRYSLSKNIKSFIPFFFGLGVIGTVALLNKKDK